MNIIKLSTVLMTILFLLGSTETNGQISVSPWQIHEGTEGVLEHKGRFNGDPSAYKLMKIPAVKDAGWELAPKDAKGNVSMKRSSVLRCLEQIDFTYFQTIVNIPPNTTVTDFKVSYDNADDGARIYFFNSKFPNGTFDEKSDLVGKHANFASANLKDKVVAGENRIVVVQFDDCAIHNSIEGIHVTVNGKEIVPQQSAASAGNGIVTVFEHIDYGGRSKALGVGTHRFGGTDFNDIISSIRVQNGYQITVYEHEPGRGKSTTFTAAISSLENSGFNDIISTIEVAEAGAASSSGSSSVGSALSMSQEINVNQRIESANGQYYAILQPDGNFCIYRGATFVWASNTAGKGVVKCAFRNDGNFCLYDSKGNVVWSTETHTAGAGNTGFRLTVDNSGALCVLDARNQNIWTSTQGLMSTAQTQGNSSSASSSGSFLSMSQEINVNQRIESANGQYYAILQPDGNFCIYRGTTFVWASNTAGKGVVKCAFRNDGNFCLYDSKGNVVWSTETHTVGAGNTGFRLTVDNSGALCVLDARNQNIWTSTHGLVRTAQTQGNSSSASSSSSSNIAVGKQAKSSSMNFGGVASRAVDGNTNGNFGDNSCTHTQDENNPWWEVDLGAVYDLSRIVIWNRTDDCCWNRLQGFHIMVSEQPITSNNTASQFQFTGGGAHSFTSGSHPSMTLEGNKKGRYIRIFIPGNLKILSLAEVEIFGQASNAQATAAATALPDKFKVHAFSINEGKGNQDDHWFALNNNNSRGVILSSARLVNGAKWMEIERVELGNNMIAFKVMNAGADMYLTARDNKEVHVEKAKDGTVPEGAKFRTIAPLTTAKGANENNYRTFESVKFANHYLRHQGLSLFVHPNSNDELFKQDASWLIQRM